MMSGDYSSRSIIARGRTGVVFSCDDDDRWLVSNGFTTRNTIPIVAKQVHSETLDQAFAIECVIAEQISQAVFDGRTIHVLLSCAMLPTSLCNYNSNDDRILTQHRQRIWSHILGHFQPPTRPILFMERAYGTVFHLFQPDQFQSLFTRAITEQDWFATLFSICHALTVLQKNFQFQHNDLHVANLFVVPIQYCDRWRNQRVDRTRNTLTLSYKCGSSKKVLLIEHSDFIVKIGDYTLSQTRTHGNESVRAERYIEYGMDGQTRAGYDWQVLLLNIVGYRVVLRPPMSVYTWVKNTLDILCPNWPTIIKRAEERKQRYYLPTLSECTSVPAYACINGVDERLQFPIENMNARWKVV